LLLFLSWRGLPAPLKPMTSSRRLKARLLHEAVEDNVATIEGRLPRPLRRSARLSAKWGARLAAATFFVAAMGAVRLAVGGGTATATATAMAPVNAGPRTPVATSRPAALTPASFSRPEPLNVATLALAVHRVVIDAGHGGTSLGTSSQSGLLEKNVTLDIAERLRQRVAASGLTVLMTRTGDESVSLQERSAMANHGQGDIFVSIHVNSMAPRNRGIETYYLGPSGAPADDAIAAHENRDSGYSLSDLRTLLDRIYIDARKDESKRLAESVQRALLRDVRRVNHAVEDRGVKTAPFVVLIGTEMPAILTEVSCLSNDDEAALLDKQEYRQSIADALFAGIRAYLSEVPADGSKETGR
jgi:N-acetylmuramoyl-L-alanine amidase